MGSDKYDQNEFDRELNYTVLKKLMSRVLFDCGTKVLDVIVMRNYLEFDFKTLYMLCERLIFNLCVRMFANDQYLIYVCM